MTLKEIIESMKKEQKDDDFGDDFFRGRKSLIENILPDLEKAAEEQEDVVKILQEENINFRNCQFKWGERYQKYQTEQEEIVKQNNDLKKVINELNKYFDDNTFAQIIFSVFKESWEKIIK